MGPDGVVIGPECVELLLQLGQGGGFWLAFEEGFQGVPDAFDFALGCCLIGFPVSLNDAFDGEEGFEGVNASGEAGVETLAIVRESGAGRVVEVKKAGELGDPSLPGH